MAASLHALIYPSAPSTIVERRMLDVAEVPAHKRAWWRPVVVVGDDAHDPATHKRTGPVTTIEARRVVDTYAVVALTAQELDDRKTAAVEALSGTALWGVILVLHNRIRALEGQPAHTMAQLKTALRALL